MLQYVTALPSRRSNVLYYKHGVGITNSVFFISNQMPDSIADKFSLLIAKLDNTFREEERLIKECIARCNKLIEELDSIECAD